MQDTNSQTENRLDNMEVTNGAFDDLAGSLSFDQSLYGRGSAASIRANQPGKDVITLNEVFLLQEWENNGLARTFVQLPIDDAFKGDFKLKGSNLDDAGNEQLTNLFKKHSLQEVKHLGYWAYWFGGGVIIVISPEVNGQSTLDQPFAVEGKNQDVQFMAVDRWRVGARMGYENSSIGALMASNNVAYTVGNKTTVYNQSVDKSRLIIMRGDIAPLISQQKLSGWGYSVLEKVSSAFDNYETCHKLIFDLMGQGMVNVIKIKNLMNSLRAGEFDHVIKFIQKSAMLKKMISTEVMDLDDERQQMQVSFSGFGDILRELRNDLASKLRIPQTKLFGMSTGGFSDGEDQIENYNTMIESTIRPTFEEPIKEVAKILGFSYMGVDVGEIEIVWPNLRSLKPIDEEDVKDKKYNRLKDQFESGFLSREDFQKKLEFYNLSE